MASTIPSVPCAPDYTGCKYKSVTLNAGEQIILPPNSEIISVSSDTGFTSDDGCYDFTKVETPADYRIFWGGQFEENGIGLGNQTQLYEKNNNYINGIKINDIYYGLSQIDGNTGNFTQSNLQSAINNAVGDGIINVIEVLYDDDDATNAWRGWTYRITIRVVSSIGDSLELCGYTSIVGSNFEDTGGNSINYCLPTIKI